MPLPVGGYVVGPAGDVEVRTLEEQPRASGTESVLCRYVGREPLLPIAVDDLIAAWRPESLLAASQRNLVPFLRIVGADHVDLGLATRRVHEPPPIRRERWKTDRLAYEHHGLPIASLNRDEPQTLTIPPSWHGDAIAVRREHRH